MDRSGHVGVASIHIGNRNRVGIFAMGASDFRALLNILRTFCIVCRRLAGGIADEGIYLTNQTQRQTIAGNCKWGKRCSQPRIPCWGGGQGWPGDGDGDGDEEDDDTKLGIMVMMTVMALVVMLTDIDNNSDNIQKTITVTFQAGQIVIIDPTDVAVERKESFVGRQGINLSLPLNEQNLTGSVFIIIMIPGMCLLASIQPGRRMGMANRDEKSFSRCLL